MIPAPLNGGPLHGSHAGLPTPTSGGAHQILLTQVDGSWHAYQLVPRPDDDSRQVLSHLGEVEHLPRMRRDA